MTYTTLPPSQAKQHPLWTEHNTLGVHITAIIGIIGSLAWIPEVYSPLSDSSLAWLLCIPAMIFGTLFFTKHESPLTTVNLALFVGFIVMGILLKSAISYDSSYAPPDIGSTIFMVSMAIFVVSSILPMGIGFYLYTLYSPAYRLNYLYQVKSNQPYQSVVSPVQPVQPSTTTAATSSLAQLQARIDSTPIALLCQQYFISPYLDESAIRTQALRIARMVASVNETPETQQVQPVAQTDQTPIEGDGGGTDFVQMVGIITLVVLFLIVVLMLLP